MGRAPVYALCIQVARRRYAFQHSERIGVPFFPISNFHKLSAYKLMKADKDAAKGVSL